MKTTRKINGAKVTRLDGKFREEVKANSVLDKIKSSIRRYARVVEKHNTISVKDVPPDFKVKLDSFTGHKRPGIKQVPSSLCAKLTSLRKEKVKVVDFWRDGAHWQIKVMA
jgi:hypothetical protein